MNTRQQFFAIVQGRAPRPESYPFVRMLPAADLDAMRSAARQVITGFTPNPDFDQAFDAGTVVWTDDVAVNDPHAISAAPDAWARYAAAGRRRTPVTFTPAMDELLRNGKPNGHPRQCACGDPGGCQ